MEEALKCPICLDIMDGAVETSCGHAFCTLCLIDHFTTEPFCPVCRKEIEQAHPSYSLRTVIDEFSQHDPVLMERRNINNNDESAASLASKLSAAAIQEIVSLFLNESNFGNLIHCFFHFMAH